VLDRARKLWSKLGQDSNVVQDHGELSYPKAVTGGVLSTDLRGIMFHRHKWTLRARIASKPYSGRRFEAEGIAALGAISLLQGQVVLVFTCECGRILEKKYPGTEVKLEDSGLPNG